MRKLIIFLVTGMLWCNVGFTASQQEYIDRHLSNKQLDLIEGVWDLWNGENYSVNIIWKQGNRYVRQSLSPKQLRCGNRGFISKVGSNTYSETGHAIKEDCTAMTTVTLHYNVDEYEASIKAYAYGDTMSLHMKRIWPSNIKSHNAKFGGSSSGDSQLSFTIKDKKEQCKAIGFKPETEKFADCVLRLVELDIKKQVDNPTSSTSTVTIDNQQIVTELQKQNNLRQSEFLMNLSQQLLTPSAPASLPSTTRCVLSPVGGNVVMNCR